MPSPPSPADPVVEAFANSDEDILSILEREGARSPQAALLLGLRRALSRDLPPGEALDLVRAEAPAGASPELCILLWRLQAAAAIRLGRTWECEALLRRSRAAAGPRTPPEILALIDDEEGVLAAMSGDHARREEILRGIVRSLPPSSPRRRTFVASLANLLAYQGRAEEIRGEIERLSRRGGPPQRRSRVAFLRFADAVECGRIGEAEREIPRIEGHPATARFFGETYAELRRLLDLLRAARGGEAPAEAALPPRDRSALHLLAGRPEEALRRAREAESESPQTLTGFGFGSLALLRAEIAAGHAETARRLLAQRRARGNRHYLDDLLSARIERLLGREAEAGRLLGSAIEAARSFRAEGRIELEIRLSCELSAGGLLRLLRPPREAEARPDAQSGSSRPSPPSPPPEPTGLDRLVGASPALEEVRRLVRRFAPLPAPVLVLGETGTGKELVARALHEGSPRRKAPFVAVHCGAIAETLLESELFGHERGAFTGADRARKGLFEEAGAGTCLLDEIGEIPPRLQVALLRVLETGEIRPVGSSRSRRIACRIVAATNADLHALVRAGRFREDLLHRLRRLEMRIPPLRERPQDIVPLARHFLSEGRAGEEPPALSRGLEEALRSRPWTGNARELRNEMERMRLLGSDKALYGPEDLAPALRDAARGAEGLPGVGEAPWKGRTALRRLERLRGLFRAHGRLTRREIAGLVGVSLNTATEDLKALAAEGTVAKVRPSRSPRSHYFQLRGDAGR